MIRFVCMLIACSMGISLAASPVTNDASQAGGKEVLKVEITEGQIDVISGVVYSQTPSLRANRALKMTLLIPRTKELKPAVVFIRAEDLLRLLTNDILKCVWHWQRLVL